jgi:hypothetical protein
MRAAGSRLALKVFWNAESNRLAEPKRNPQNEPISRTKMEPPKMNRLAEQKWKPQNGTAVQNSGTDELKAMPQICLYS